MANKPVVINSSADIRNFLLTQMVAVSEGKQETTAAKAISNYAQQVYNTINLEMKMAQMKHKTGGDVQLVPVSFNN